MSHINFCDICGVELGNGKGIYRAEISTPGETWRGARYDLCIKCAKPLLEWKTVHPKRKMVPVEDE